MTSETLGTRLQAAMKRAKLSAAELSRAANTTEATIHNWLNDNARVEHVKAKMLFSIARAVKADPYELLLGEPSKIAYIGEARATYEATSQDLKPEALTLAFQLVEEALAGKNLPPEKRAEMVQICYDLIAEGLPRAKVLRLARAVA